MRGRLRNCHRPTVCWSILASSGSLQRAHRLGPQTNVTAEWLPVAGLNGTTVPWCSQPADQPGGMTLVMLPPTEAQALPGSQG